MKNINKKNNGITLIALVITIIVLLILAGVTISMVLGDDGIIEQATHAKDMQEKEAELERVKLAIASAVTAGRGKIDLSENSGEGNSIKKALASEFENEKAEEKPNYEEGIITLSNGDTYSVTTSGSLKKVITFSKTGNLVIGTEVTASNGEKFYVIGEGEVGTEVNGETQNDILLLAKYNLKKENGNITLKQDTDGDTFDEDTYMYSNACAFSSTNYWDPDGELSYPDTTTGKYPDLNDKSKYPLGSATSIITIAEEYGESLGATGKLMTYEEASILNNKSNDIKNILYGKYESGKFINYWLGSADYDVDYVWSVDGECSRLVSNLFDFADAFGVRPVIKISESLIK